MNNEIKPKHYTHIDYEALLIYAMKNRKSIDSVIQELNLNIARSTVVRNIQKIRNENPNNDIINLYQNIYVPNMQKDELPDIMIKEIDNLVEKPIVIKVKTEDLFIKLNYMKNIIDRCNGNVSKATRIINSGNTPLGNVKISCQGLRKNLLQYEKVKEQYKKEKEKEARERGD